MKPFRYSIIAALFTLLLATSCEKDPVPPVYNYRTAKALNSLENAPGYMRYVPFCIADKAYVFVGTDYNSYNNLALYEYHSTNNQWNLAWHVDSHFQPSGDGNDQHELEEYELQREICDQFITVLDQQRNFGCCAFNGKGYYFTEDAVMEFDPQAHRWSFKPLYYPGLKTIISTTQGIFQVGNYKLSKYDIATNTWRVESNIPQTLWNQTDIFIHQDQIYIYLQDRLLGIYTPSTQQWEVKEHGIDFSSYQEDNYPIETPFITTKTNFVLNNKYYLLYDNRYYEYNLATGYTCILLLNKDSYYISQLNHAFVINNRAFLIDTQENKLMEFIP